MDMDDFKNKLTIDHSNGIQEIVGRVAGIVKNTSSIVVNEIQFALKENPLAHFAYNMLKGGYVTDFSIETYGPPPTEDGVYYNSHLVGLSMVVVGNNRQATLEQLYKNSLDEALAEGLDVSTLKSELFDNSTKGGETIKMFKTIKNNRTFDVVVNYKNVDGEEAKAKLEPDDTVDVDEEQADDVQAQIDKAVEPKDEKEEVKPALDANTAVLEEVRKLSVKLEQLDRAVLNNKAAEPTFRKEENRANDYSKTDWKTRTADQVNAAWDMLKNSSLTAGNKLSEINKFNLEQLQKEGIVSNTMTISDFGNFVISPELLSQIEGTRSNFRSLLDRVDFRDTTSLQMAWLTRDGDINMTEVETCDDGANGNLKPISEYDADIHTSNLHELAAVTPVCNAATRFLAADLLGDVAAGYRTDFDRKKAQLLIARLQQAVNSTGNTSVYATTSDVNSVKSWMNILAPVAEFVQNGVFIFNHSTYSKLLADLVGAGVSGPLAGLFTTGDQPTILGTPYIVVPNELMPTINTAAYKTFTVEGVSVTINQAVFYADLSTFTGRTSGGLQYDLSTEAAYEVASVVKSAFQRNELVLRGSFFRGGAVRNEDLVAGLGAPGVS